MVKLIETYETETRDAVFHGISLRIPAKHRYLCTDHLGNVFSSVNEPFCGATQWHFQHDYDIVARVELDGLHWRMTMVEIR